MLRRRLPNWLKLTWLQNGQTVAIVFALLGALLGAYASYAVTQYQMHVGAGHLADMWVERANDVSDDAVKALNTLAHSTLPICSDADLTLLNKTVFLSRYVKSASRAVDGILLCSTALGRLKAPFTLPQPDFVSDHGHRVYFDAEVLGTMGLHATYIGLGTASVSLTSDAYRALADTRLQYEGVSQYGNRLFVFMSNGVHLPLVRSDLKSGQPYYHDGVRYEVRCSKSHSGCIVAKLDTPMPGTNAPMIACFVLAGLLAGAAFGYASIVIRDRRRSMSRMLKVAVRRGELITLYQPIVELSTRRMVGAEALVRWKRADGLQVNPEVFIALAESEGFISQITHFILRKVLSELHDLGASMAAFHITINIAAADLADPHFPQFVSKAIAEFKIDPTCIGFEITERSTANKTAVSSGIRALRKAGHRIYIDDFGTEYSALSYLADLEIDAIKLDHSFCRTIPEDERSGHIATQIVRLAKLLNLGVVIEGIEHETQAAYFNALDLSVHGQGWLFGRPITAAALGALTLTATEV